MRILSNCIGKLLNNNLEAKELNDAQYIRLNLCRMGRIKRNNACVLAGC